MALNEIRSAGVTAFDLFGILLPGVLLLVAVRIGLVPFNGPITSSFEQFGYATWIALLVLSILRASCAVDWSRGFAAAYTRLSMGRSVPAFR